MKRYFITIIMFLLVHLGCNKKIENCIDVDKKDILILDKRVTNQSSVKSFLVNNDEALVNICDALTNSGSSIAEPDVRFNSGFLEVIFQDNNNLYFYIIFTDYNGPVIKFNNRYYKNDRLLTLLKKIKSDLIL